MMAFLGARPADRGPGDRAAEPLEPRRLRRAGDGGRRRALRRRGARLPARRVAHNSAMPITAVITDSTADLMPDQAAAAGIRVAPLVVTFGTESFQVGVDLTTQQFWDKLLAPGAPIPSTAAPSPGTFKTMFEQCFADGADAIVCCLIGAELSGTVRERDGRGLDAARSRDPHHGHPLDLDVDGPAGAAWRPSSRLPASPRPRSPSASVRASPTSTCTSPWTASSTCARAGGSRPRSPSWGTS